MTRWNRFLVALATALVSFSTQASVERAIEAPAEGVKEIQISGFKGNLRVFSDPPQKTIKGKWTLKGYQEGESHWQPVVERQGARLLIRVLGPSAKVDWGKQMPSLDLELHVGGFPLSISWKEGEIQIPNWAHPIQLTLLKGKITMDGGTAPLRITCQDGEVNVKSYTAPVEIDGLTATLNLSQISGPIKITNFSGKLKLSDSEGTIVLKSFQGKNVLDKFKGSLDFAGGRGELSALGFRGPVQAAMEQGSFSADLLGAVEARIKSESGRVSLTVPKASGARVDLTTSEGTFAVAANLNQQKADDVKFLKGVLSGSEEGLIQVRTESGEIRLSLK